MTPEDKKILIIDDELDIIEIVSLRLAASGFSVETAHNGEEGLQKMREWRPDLIVLDLVMPKMSGIEVIRQMKMDSKISSIPVIVVTAKSQGTRSETCEEIGEDNCLLKPFDMNALVEKIRCRLKGAS